jgi:hypothetical protein
MHRSIPNLVGKFEGTNDFADLGVVDGKIILKMVLK